MDKAEIMTV